jgi:zinc transport system substrate-binding protein
MRGILGPSFQSIFLYFLILSGLACSDVCAAPTSPPQVLVSVSPYKFFVEKIAGDTVSVNLLVPSTASSHTYEPTPKQMIHASKADIWFFLGESFETRAINTLKKYSPEMDFVDLRTHVDMISTDPHSGRCCCHAGGQDLHIWLSARQAKIQAQTIAQALIHRYPQHTQRYEKALGSFLEELSALDTEIQSLLPATKKRLILVSHPAYAYFCRDYNIEQLSIEFEGKDPTPRQLDTTLNKARTAQVCKVFVQSQYSDKGARLIAKELGNAQVINLDPYAENYLNAMRTIAYEFASDTCSSE